MTVVRPVQAENPLKGRAFIDPKSGALTDYGFQVLTRLWERTGGFDDEFVTVLAGTLLSQASGLAATGKAEATQRALGDALQQVQGQSAERLRALVEEGRRSTDAFLSQMVGGLARPPQTRIITFTANDVWRPAPDLRSVTVFAVGGGGGGAGGAAGSNGGGGGGGAGYSWAAIDPRLLPDSITVTVGAAGAGGAAGANGGAGGASTFGTYVAASGGLGGASGGAGGAAGTLPGALFLGGVGGAGGGGAGNDAPNNCLGCPGGGGGAYYTSGGEIGGAGGAGGSRTTNATGGGGAGGIVGADGSSVASSETYIGPGFGGGGGGATSTTSGQGGHGFNGAGGGGGGARPGSARSGGAGGSGKIWVVEVY